MDLAELVFKVNTTELKDAAAKVKELGTAVSNLSKPLAKLSKEQMQAAVQEEKLSRERAKTTEATAKAEAAQARAAKATGTLTEATKEQQSVLKRQQDILDFMSQGLSKGQASTLAYAQATGAASDEIKTLIDVLQAQRRLQGGDPFDKSTAGLIALKNRLTEVREAYRQYNKETGLTKEQTRELARDKERAIELLKLEAEQAGRSSVSYSAIKTALRQVEAEYLKHANLLNGLVGFEKEHERQLRESANAVRALAREEEKVDSVVSTLTGSTDHHTKTSERAAESIARYSRNLRLAGVTGVEAAKKLSEYEKKIRQIQDIEEKRKVDLLSRSLAPQISDVVVSLGSGMNPMTVLLQQGLQVRDLIGQSGVEVAQLQKAFRSAASDMVSSIKGTAVALGSLLVGSIVDAGKAATDFLIQPFKLAGLSLMGAAKNADSMAIAAERLKLAILSVGKIGIVAAISAVVGLAVGLKQVIQEEDNLAKSLALSGGALNVSHTSAIQYAKSLNEVGISTGKAIEVITAMAAAGKLTANDISLVTKAAVDLEKYGGVAIEDTVKSFVKMKEKPVEAMFDLARATGMVAPEVIKAVVELEKQGRTAEATALAIKSLAEVNSTQVNQMKQDYTGFALFMKELSSSIAGFFAQVFKDLWQKADPKNALETQLANVRKQMSEFNPLVIFGPSMDELKAQANALELQIASITRRNRAQEDYRANVNATNGLLEKALGLETTYAGKANEKAKALKEANTLYDKLIAKGERTEADRQKVLAGIEEKYKQSAAAKSEQEKQAVKDARTLAGFQKKLNDYYVEQLGLKEEMLETDELYLEIIMTPEYQALPDTLKRAATATYEHARKAELRNKEEQKYIEILKTQFATRLLGETQMQDFRDKTKEMNLENVSLEEELMLIGLDSAAIADINRTKQVKYLQDKTEELKQSYLYQYKEAGVLETLSDSEREQLQLMEDQVEALRRKLELTDAIANAKETEALTNSITDAIVDGLMNGGKAGGQKLRDILKAELSKPITVFVKAVVGELTGLTGATASGQSGGLSGVLSSFTDLLSGEAGTIFGDKLATSVFNFGRSLGDTGVGGFLQSNANTIGQIGGMASNAFSGYGISKTLSNGYKIDGLNVNAIAALASTVFGPIAGVVGGVVNQLFGRKFKDSGIQGNFTNSGFSGSKFEFYEGGLLSSDKTKTSTLDSATKTAFGQQFLAIKASTKAMADVLGLNSEYIENYTKKIKISTKGLSAAKTQEAIAKVFGNIQEDLAKSLLGTFETSTTSIGWKQWARVKTTVKWIAGEFVRTGETATEALTRIFNSLTAVNSVLDLFGMTQFDTSLSGGDTASKLIDLFGGSESFTTSTGAYYDAFFTEEERAQKAMELLAEQFDTLNLTLPTSIQGYRDLVEAQDLSTEEGRKNFAALIQLSAGFASATEAFQEFGTAIEEEIARLRGEVLKDSVDAYAAMQSQFAITTAAARAGDKNALSQLPELSSQVETAFLSQAGSAEDVARVRAWLADSLFTTLNVLGIPGFASGGLHAGGMRIVGEDGPELEVTGPSRIYSANQTANLFDNSELILELQSLREEVVMLRSEVRADVVHNAKTAKLLDRIIPDGDAIQTRVVT